jgi:ParB-like chromosome segregation protein Spo0J
MPIVLNQDNVILYGHHRLRACKELGIPISYSKKDFTGKPLEELKYVVSVNLHRRHLDEFQLVEIAQIRQALSKDNKGQMGVHQIY